MAEHTSFLCCGCGIVQPISSRDTASFLGWSRVGSLGIPVGICVGRTCMPVEPRHAAFGAKLKNRRGQKSLSKSEVGLALGVRPGRLSEFESGYRLPPRELLTIYAALLGVDAESLRRVWDAEFQPMLDRHR